MQNVKQISELRLYRNIGYVCQTQSSNDNPLQTSLDELCFSTKHPKKLEEVDTISELLLNMFPLKLP